MSEPMMIRIRAGAPAKAVYHALTDPTAMRVWLDEHAEVDLPHRYAFWGRHTLEGDAPRQRLLHADDRTLRFAWPLGGEETVVEIRLEERGPEETELTLTQTGLPSFEEMVAETGVLSLAHTFWAVALANLVDHVEGREPTPKCDFTSPVMREEVFIAASPQAVYDSIVDPGTFARWFGAKVEIEPHVGGRWAMGSFEAEPSPARITELEPGRRMSLLWEEGLVASWELEESGGGTKLTFVQSGFDEGNPPYGAWMGWLSGIAELRRFHELRPWRPIWLATYVEGMPEGFLTIGEDA
ncbi:SRPBCC family protein [Planobispora rosea]|nr:SRPBCC domain-containing protein [Planobispora rosea]